MIPLMNLMGAHLTNWKIVSVIASLLVLFIGFIIWIVRNWDKFIFLKMNYFYRWPFIGRMSTHKSSLLRNEETGWYDGERRLCEDFYPRYAHFNNQSKKIYDDCTSYLAKADEIGRAERPLWWWIVLSVFVLAEAAIFAKLILSFSGELSNNDIKWISFIVAFFIASALLFLTEKMGQELYKNSKIKKIRLWHSHDKTAEHSLPRPNLDVHLGNNGIDDDAKDYQKILNRMNTNASVSPSYTWSIFTVLVIVSIAVLAFIERAALNADLLLESSAAGAYASYAFYSILFFIIQAMGIGLAYLYSFSSKEGKRAWLIIHKYINSDEYLKDPRHQAKKIAEIAQNRLGYLQQYILKRFPENENEKVIARMHNRTFLEYATQQQKEI